MVVVAVIVYNRFHNLKAWIKYWQMSETAGAELVIIHNDNGESSKFKAICEKNNIPYIKRQNIGFDIGAFQDACRERLKGFPDFDHLLWITDDTVPMTKDFISPFLKQIKESGVGISCMQISKSVTPHVRTTGFMVSKEVSKRIQFPADPVSTKQHCYHFEHRGAKQILTNQIREMGLSCEMVSDPRTSPLWDTGYWKRLDRQEEHDRVFNPEKVPGDKVTFICTIFNTYPQIISSLLLQTHKNWELILIHDGPSENGIKSYIPKDERVKYIETEKRVGNWGHALRKWALEEIGKGNFSDTDYIVITNADNYHTPRYTEYLLRGFKKSHTAVATYCDSMVHSYKDWQVIPVKFERGYIDCAGVMVKKEIACEVGWNDTESHSSDWTYFSEIAAKYSPKNFVPVKGCLLVHN